MIFINGRFLTQPATGVQRFARELLLAVDDILEQNPSAENLDLTCLVPAHAEMNHLPDWKHIKISRVGKSSGNVWEQVELPFFARKGFLINLCNIGPFFHSNQLLVIHDASVFAVPEAYSFFFKLKYRVNMLVLSRTAKKVVTVSRFSQNELAKYLHIQKKKIELITEGCEHIQRIEADESILQAKHLLNKNYLLAVGSSSAHKNLAKVIEAVGSKPDSSLFLVVAGGNYSKVFSGVRRYDDPHVLHLGYVSDNQLRALYENAAAFIFPSLYEGFGIPPLEAMSCGCPVISSDKASLPEVCADAALYFDPLNAQEIYAQINRLVNDQELQDQLRQKGRERAAQFTWHTAAEKLIQMMLGGR